MVRSGAPSSHQYRRASLAAVSIPSPPPDPRKIRAGIGARSASACASSSAGRLAKSPKTEYASRRVSCSATAAPISGLPCPTFAYQRLAVASRYRWPSLSHTHTSSAWSITSSACRTAPMSANGCQSRVSPVLLIAALHASAPGAARVAQVARGDWPERVSGAAGAGSPRTPALDHEIRDHAMENDPVVEAIAGELAEVGDCLGRVLVV